jgi:dTDP-4-dehydrorhamnose reductase
MTILITGGSGQVGFELVRHFSLLGTVLAPTRQALDLTDENAVATYLAAHQPELILNAAAYTAVDKAEEEQALAQRLNADLPAQLAAYAAQNDVTLVHYSSDYVYSGEGDTPWRENSSAMPLCVYGQTKLTGDQAVQASGCPHLIFRTSWVYAARANNVMNTMLRLGRERDGLEIVDDQIGAPTPARLIAQITLLALERRIPGGLYHLAPHGETSWYGFADAIFLQAERFGESLNITAGNVAGIPTTDYPTPARRPLNSRLDVTKLERALGVTLPKWQSQLALTLEEHLTL